MACSFCRQRKRRCDGSKPTCGACATRNLTCVYEDNGPRNNSSRPRSISAFGPTSIRAIESLLESHSNALRNIQNSIPSPDSSSNTSAVAAAASICPNTYFAPIDRSGDDTSYPGSRNLPFTREWFTWPETRTKSPYMREESSELPALTIPPGHEASSSNLLDLPQVHALVGEFPGDFFFRVETQHSRSFSLSDSNHGKPATDEMPHISREMADILVGLFLEEVHIFHPLFEEHAFYTCYETTFDRGFQHDEKSALVLLSFALGTLMVDHGRGAPFHDMDFLPSRRYFQPAQRILLSIWAECVGNNILLSQGLFLCSLYLTYLTQPLLAMKHVHMASTSAEQHLIRSRHATPPNSQVQEVIRLNWACFVIECDILAEFHQPRSDIQFLADRMLFPSCGDPPSISLMYFLAEISARSLVNRVHCSINFTDSISTYTRSTPSRLPLGADFRDINSDSSLRSVCNELTHQLETWYSSLPAEIRPELMPDAPDHNIQSCLLRCRYWSTMNKIHRPFIFKATSMPDDVPLPQCLREKCQMGIASCRMYLKSVGGLLRKRSPYVYTASHGAFASALVLSISAQSPNLREYVLDLDSLVSTALEAMQPWAEDGSAVQNAFEILKSMRNKYRYRELN